MIPTSINLSDKKIRITGAAGFIGANLVMKIIKEYPDAQIVGVDNLNDYYDVSLKHFRLEQIEKISSGNQWRFVKGSIADREMLENLFKENHFDIVVNLAAQAGVRYSLINPYSYINNNINGFYNVIENCKNYNIEHLIYASSSSVYGNYNDTSKPESLYAVTKKTNELISYSYSQNYDLKTTGLRFFSVYGPYGRPDMAYYSFTENLINNKEIEAIL